MKYLTNTKACKFFQFCGNAWFRTIDGNLFMYLCIYVWIYLGFMTDGVQFPVFRQDFMDSNKDMHYLAIALSSSDGYSCFLIVTGPSVLIRKKRPASSLSVTVCIHWMYIHNNKGCLMFYVDFGGAITSLFMILMFDRLDWWYKYLCCMMLFYAIWWYYIYRASKGLRE